MGYMDRRQSERIICNIPCSIFTPDCRIYYSGVATNISPIGIGVELMFYDESSNISGKDIVIECDQFRVTGNAVRVDRTESGYFIGVWFAERLSDEILQNMIHR